MAPMADAPAPLEATAAAGHRPSTAALLYGQFRYANRTFWRTPVAAFFTLAFPLMLLLIFGTLFGNQTIDYRQGVRVAQFLAPALAVYAAVTAAFTSLSIALAIAREQGILKRLRGTSLPPWVFMTGRVLASVWIGLIGVVVMLAVGVGFYHVQILGRTLVASVVTLAVGIGCFAALGLALVSLVRSSSAVQGISSTVILVLGFVSDVFLVGVELPRWLSTIGSIFPLKHFANALGDAFNPFLSGSGFAWRDLAVMAAWGLGGVLVALWRFSWEPYAEGGGVQAAAGRPAAAVVDEAAAGQDLEPVATGGPPTWRDLGPAEPAVRPSTVTLLRNQFRYANRELARDPASVFFAVVLPALLAALFPAIFGQSENVPGRGVPLPQFLAPVLAVYGITVAAYVNLPEGIARARDLGVLKRLRGTPLPGWAYLAGRIGSALWVGLLAMVATIGVGVLRYDVRIVGRTLPAVLVTIILGTACMGALGLAVAALSPNVQTFAVVALATLLPLSFISDIFIIGGDLPRWVEIAGWLFPLKHLANAMADAFNPTIGGSGFAWGHLAVVVAWGIVGMLVAAARLRFDPGGDRRAGVQPRQPRVRHGDGGAVGHP
jgi:ABC-2 type transport system permease protein